MYIAVSTQTGLHDPVCSNCGAPVPETAKFCNECGARLTDRVFAGQLPPVQGAGGEKSTFLAVAGSMFVPGLGQVYQGNILKGYLVFFGTFFGFFLLIIPGLIMWLYGSTMLIRPQTG